MYRRALFLSFVLGLTGCAMFGGHKAEQPAAVQQTGQQTSSFEAAAQTPSDLQIAWGVDVDQRRPLAPYSFARPVLVGGLIVLAGQDSFVHIYNMNGRELRRIALQAPSNSDALALSHKLVVLGDVQGILYGIDPQQGKILWQWQMPSDMLGRPVQVGHDMLVQTGDNSIYRISAKGEKLWSFSSTQAGLNMLLTPSPLVVGNTCYAMLTSGDAVALRCDTGDLLWRRQLLLDNDAVVLSELKTPIADPVLVGDVLIVSFYQGSLIGLSARDGQQIWQRGLSLKSSPLVYQGRLFAASGNSILELDPSNGTTLWKRTLQAGDLVGPTLEQGRLFAADAHGRIFALNLDGRITGETSLPGRIDRSPVAASGGVLLRNNLGGLYLIH
jgi:outer membrane protein assembly factor BamB